MFPIKDHNPSGKTPIVTYLLIAANVLIWLYTYFAIMSQGDIQTTNFFEDFALKPVEIMNSVDLHTLISSMFLHGSWMHVIGNMVFLFIYGDNLEARLGHLKFILFYIIAGLAASTLQIALNQDSQIFNVGASGAIAGILGGYILLYPKARVDMLLILGYIMRKMTWPAYMVIGYWFGLQLFMSITSIGAPDVGGVAYWAHTGGFIAGALLILPVWLKDKNNKPTFVKAHWRNRP